MILKKKVFGSAMLAAAIMSAGTCTAMAAPQQENTAIEAESENSAQTAAGLALKITEGFQNADEQASIEKKEVEVVKASEEEPQDEWQNRLMADVDEFYAIGGEEYLQTGLCIFEWGEMIENIIQDDYIRITFSRDNDADNLDLRKLRIEEIKNEDSCC